MFFLPWIRDCRWAFPIALLGLVIHSPVGAYGTHPARFDFPMVVVEPTLRPETGKVKPASLNSEEVTRALVFRMNTQRALRNLKARRLALHRHQGVKAWRREMEVYLAAQKQLKANPPQAKPPAVGNPLRPAPDGKPSRKSNSVLA